MSNKRIAGWKRVDRYTPNSLVLPLYQQGSQ
jgi:hypothetical protein